MGRSEEGCGVWVGGGAHNKKRKRKREAGAEKKGGASNSSNSRSSENTKENDMEMSRAQRTKDKGQSEERGRIGGGKQG